MRYLVVDASDTILNVIELDPSISFKLPAGQRLVVASGPGCCIGLKLGEQPAVPPEPTLDQKAAAAADRMDRFQFELFFNLENRVRVLEGKAAITRVQYRTALVNAYKAMP